MQFILVANGVNLSLSLSNISIVVVTRNDQLFLKGGAPLLACPVLSG
jgi:hypothetical protein